MGYDYPNLMGDAQALNQIMSKHKARIDLMFYNMNLPAEYTLTEVYKSPSGGVHIFFTDQKGDIYYVAGHDSGLLDYYDAYRVIPPTDDYKKRYPGKKWEWECITPYLVGLASEAENKAVPGNAFQPLANIQLTTEVKVGDKLTDCQNVIIGPEDNVQFPIVNFWFNGALNGEWRNSVFNVIADCTTPGDAVAVMRVGDSEKYKDGRGVYVSFVLLPKGSYHPENGIAAYPRIDLDLRKNGESK